jgi:hypothetical protein
MLVSGMAIGTFFTLVVLPVVYLLIASQHQPKSVPMPVDSVDAVGGAAA